MRKSFWERDSSKKEESMLAGRVGLLERGEEDGSVMGGCGAPVAACEVLDIVGESFGGLLDGCWMAVR